MQNKLLYFVIHDIGVKELSKHYYKNINSFHATVVTV